MSNKANVKPGDEPKGTDSNADTLNEFGFASDSLSDADAEKAKNDPQFAPLEPEAPAVEPEPEAETVTPAAEPSTVPSDNPNAPEHDALMDRVNPDISALPGDSPNVEAVWGKQAGGEIKAYANERECLDAGATVVERVRTDLAPMLSSAPAYLSKTEG